MFQVRVMSGDNCLVFEEWVSQMEFLGFPFFGGKHKPAKMHGKEKCANEEVNNLIVAIGSDAGGMHQLCETARNLGVMNFCCCGGGFKLS